MISVTDISGLSKSGLHLESMGNDKHTFYVSHIFAMWIMALEA